MSKIIDKLIEDIIELVLENMDCQHEVGHDEDGDHTSVEYNLNYGATVRVKIMALLKPKVIEGKDWLPTAENINALPEPVRNYIADMQTNADPPSMVADNIIMKDTIKTLEKMLEERPAVDEGFVNTWAKELIMRVDSVRGLTDMLREAGVEVVKNDPR